MRKSCFSALMISLLLLTGCGSQQAKIESEFEAFRSNLRAAENISFSMEMTWDDGETVSDYALAVYSDGEECHVTVEEPELIADVEAVIDADGTTIGSSDLMLAVGEIDGLTPLTAASELLEALCYDYEELYWREDEYLAIRLWRSDGNAVDVWLDSDRKPVCAVFYHDGISVAGCNISAWEIY